MNPPTKTYAQKILRLLREHYPHAHMVLEWTNNWELLIAIILSAQCTDLMVNKVTKNLFPEFRKDMHSLSPLYKKYNTLIHLPRAQQHELINFGFVARDKLEHAIKATGFYRNKAKHIQEAARILIEKFNGIPPKTIAALTTIPGVGRKTANVFLGNAYHIYEGIAVDTHVKKMSQKLGLSHTSNPEKIEKDLQNLYDKKDWFSLAYLLIEYGRNMRRSKELRHMCHNSHCIICYG